MRHSSLTTVVSLSTAGAASIVVGDVRVTALSDTLLRLEPRGPAGFENRSTFNVVGRDAFDTLPIAVLNTSAAGTWLGTSSYQVFLPGDSAAAAPPSCHPKTATDALNPTRSSAYPNGAHAATAAACCALCSDTPDCTAWIASTGSEQGVNCWPLASTAGTKPESGRTFGLRHGGRAPATLTNATVVSLGGRVLWQGANTGESAKVEPNELHWPSPLSGGPAYGFSDFPRFHVPDWGPTPIPPAEKAALDPALLATNGYDFANDVAGDTYVFLLGDSLESWWQSRAEFLQLTGPTPLLPDFAYGIWYTWYIKYTEQRAKDEIGNWTQAQLPLDVWALDMNWREIAVNSSDPVSVKQCKEAPKDDGQPDNCRDHFYDHPALDLIPGLASPANEWFEYLKAQKLRTYFNDHPFPKANQTSMEEVDFRYNGISEWIGRGLSFWWFDQYVVRIDPTPNP